MCEYVYVCGDERCGEGVIGVEGGVIHTEREKRLEGREIVILFDYRCVVFSMVHDPS